MIFIFKEMIFGIINLIPYTLLAIVPTILTVSWLIKNDLLGAGTPSRSKEK